MVAITVSFLALVIVGCVFQFRMADKAPVGYQDETGFHFGALKEPITGDTEYLPVPDFAFQTGRQHGSTPRPVVAVSANHA